MKRQAAGLALGVVLGALLALWLGGDEPASSPAEDERGAAALASAQATAAELARLRGERDALLGERDALRGELEALRAGLGEAEGGELAEDYEGEPGADDAEGALTGGAAAEGDALAHGAGAPAEAQRPRWFDPAALERAGYPPGEIERVRDAWDRTAMLRLELEDARTRSGEQGIRPVMRDELLLERRMRAEVGDETWDALLYASGEQNRVILRELIEDAPGAVAGLAPGDEVISYDGQRVFYPRDLKRLTGAGTRGEPVELRVRREGEAELLRIFLPRGPIGARLDVESLPPLR